MIPTRRVRGARSAVPAALAILFAMGTACTSGGDDARTTAPASGSSGAPSSSTSPPPTRSSSPPAGSLGAVDGAVLVLGPGRDRADVYRVAGGAFQRVTRTGDITSVSTGAGHTVIGVANRDGDESVRELRGSGQRGVAVPAGFDPAVSRDGALAWIGLDAGAGTPGISKPKGFTLTVRPSLRGRDRVVFRTAESMASAHWVGEHTVLVAVEHGARTQLVRVDTRTRARSVLATIPDAADLEVTTAGRVASVVTGSGAVLVGLTDRAQHQFPRGWTPLCWPDAGTILATRSGRLATVPVSAAGTAASPRVLGPLPAGTNAYGGACG